MTLITRVLVSEDGKRLLASGLDGQNCVINVWDTQTGRVVRQLISEHELVPKALSGDGSQIVYYQTGVGKSKLINVVDEKNNLNNRGDIGRINAAVFSPDGRSLATGGEDGTVAVVDLASGRNKWVSDGYAGTISVMSFSPDGRWLTSAGEDQTIRIWYVHQGKLLRTFRGHAGRINSVKFNADGRRLVSNGQDDIVRVWDISEVQTPSLVDRNSFHAKGCSYQVRADDNWVVAAGNPATIYDPSTGVSRPLRGRSEETNSISFNYDGTRVAAGGSDGNITIWDAATQAPLITLKGHSKPVWAVAFSPDGNQLASGSEDHTVRVWNVRTGKQIFDAKGSGNPSAR